uniref:Uncharacterized protein n=1 Tax=Periophthalmus magnuspinnatus TaxID=409849 RepID=A0A3B4AU38_9GOBI
MNCYSSYSCLCVNIAHFVIHLPAATSGSGQDELLSSSSIFDHVDRVSKGSSDCTRRPANKVQLIAMQPRPSPSSQRTPPHRGQYDDLPSSSRPRPVGGSTGAQLHHLTQVGISSQIGAYPGVGHQDLSRPGASRESVSVLSFPEFSSSSVFQMPSSSLRDSQAPPLLLTSPTPEYPPDDASPSAHTSASLIKAIREELRRLAQKQTWAVHSLK